MCLRQFYLPLSSIFIHLSQESDQCAVRARLGVAGHRSTTPRWGIPLSTFSMAQQVDLPACSPHCPFDAERQAGKL